MRRKNVAKAGKKDRDNRSVGHGDSAQPGPGARASGAANPGDRDQPGDRSVQTPPRPDQPVPSNNGAQPGHAGQLVDDAQSSVDCSNLLVQTPTQVPSRRQVRKARRLAKRATRLCRRKKYQRCADAYRSAYGLDGNSDNLQSLGETYHAMGEHEPAICAYRQYLAAMPTAATAAQVEPLLATLHGELTRARRQEAERAAALQQAAQLDCSEWAVQTPVETPSRSEKRQARRRARAAKKLLQRGDIPTYVEELKAAYTIDGKSVHLRDIGDAYRSVGEPKAAICSYFLYMGSGVDSTKADPIVERIVALHRTLADTREQQTHSQQEIQKAVAAIGCADRSVSRPDGPPSRQNINRARKRFREAQERCDSGLLSECSESIKAVYALDGDSRHLFSLGRVAEQIPDPESAICHYHQFLTDRQPNGPLLSLAKKRLALLSERYNQAREEQERLAMTAHKAEQISAELEKAKETIESESAGRKTAENQAEKLDKELEVLKTEREKVSHWVTVKGRSTAGSVQRHLGTTLMGLGSLAVGAAIMYGVKAKQASDDVSQARPWSTQLDDLVKDGESAQQRAVLLGAVGGAAIVTGIVLYYLGERASRNVEVELDIGRSGEPVGASVWLGGQF